MGKKESEHLPFPSMQYPRISDLAKLMDIKGGSSNPAFEVVTQSMRALFSMKSAILFGVSARV
jgi:hypothetical protein